mmetsp:Transcript_19672/g.41146  ORF Transcript_19672/g.41146 Transcript_19672/m.41146 type:complete len:567 (-) Transcript_19672:40-1740(-)
MGSGASTDRSESPDHSYSEHSFRITNSRGGALADSILTVKDKISGRAPNIGEIKEKIKERSMRDRTPGSSGGSGRRETKSGRKSPSEHSFFGSGGSFSGAASPFATSERGFWVKMDGERNVSELIKSSRIMQVEKTNGGRKANVVFNLHGMNLPGVTGASNMGSLAGATILEDDSDRSSPRGTPGNADGKESASRANSGISSSPSGVFGGSHHNEFQADVVPGKFLFVGLGGVGKTTLINLMSVKRRFQNNLPPHSQPDVSFMLPSAPQTFHDPISSALSLERRGSTVVKTSPSKKRRKTLKGAMGMQKNARSNKLGGGSTSGVEHVPGGRRGSQLAIMNVSKDRRVSEATIKKDSPPNSPLRSSSETLSPRTAEKARILSPASGSMVTPTGVELNTEKLNRLGGHNVARGGPLPLPASSSSPQAFTCLCRGHVFTALDMPGRPAFRHSWYQDLQGVKGIVMVVDVGDKEVIGMAKREISRLGRIGGQVPVLVLGNKSDTVTTKNEGYDDEVGLSEVLEVEKNLRNEGGRMWTVRIVTARNMESVGDAMCWILEERLREGEKKGRR